MIHSCTNCNNYKLHHNNNILQSTCKKNNFRPSSAISQHYDHSLPNDCKDFDRLADDDVQLNKSQQASSLFLRGVSKLILTFLALIFLIALLMIIMEFSHLYKFSSKPGNNSIDTTNCITN